MAAFAPADRLRTRARTSASSVSTRERGVPLNNPAPAPRSAANGLFGMTVTSRQMVRRCATAASSDGAGALKVTRSTSCREASARSRW